MNVRLFLPRHALALGGIVLATSHCAPAAPAAQCAASVGATASAHHQATAPNATGDAHAARAAAAEPCVAAIATRTGPAAAVTVAPGPSEPSPAGVRLALARGQSSMPLQAGRWVIRVAAEADHYVSIGVAGPRDALQAFEVVGHSSLRALRSGTRKDDGLLPTFASFESPSIASHIDVIVDVTAPVKLLRASVDKRALAPPRRALLRADPSLARPLIGFPFPIERRDGYLLQTSPRYTFLRSDVVAALRGALRQTRIRFRRNRIAIGDATQWNGIRPATDLDEPRHISHQQGRDVDLGLPSTGDGSSLLRRRCEGVMIEKDVLQCGPGTVKKLDARRLAYFLGLLIDGPTPGGRHVPKAERRPGPIAEVETIFTDQAYIDEIRKALPELKRRRWIHDEAFGALGEEGLLRPSAWHVDHLHIRFSGEPARIPAALAFDTQPPTTPVDD